MDVGTWNVCGVRELCGTLGRAERRLLRLAEDSFVSRVAPVQPPQVAFQNVEAQ